MPGFPKEILVDASNFVERLKCVICHLLLRLAVQTTCGHRFCESCVKAQIGSVEAGSEPRCPACPSDSSDSLLNTEEIYPDFHARKELKALAAKCPNESCPWRGTFLQYMEHEPFCDLTPVSCSQCAKQLRRGDLPYHLEKDCQMREVRCGKCGQKCFHKDLKKHLSDCGKVTVTCGDCKQKMLREKLKDHQNPEIGDCPKRRQTCPYVKYGCKIKVTGDGLDKHLQTEVSYHSQLQNQVFDELAAKVEALLIKSSPGKISQSPLGQTVADADLGDQQKSGANGSINDMVITNKQYKIPTSGREIDNLIDQMKEVFVLRAEEGERSRRPPMVNNSTPKSAGYMNQERKIKELESKVNDKNQELDQLRTLYAVLDKRNETFQEVVAVLNNQLEAQAEKLSALERQNRHLQDTIELQERQIHAHDQMLTVKNVALAEQELRIQSLESSSYNGILVWKITEYARRRREAVSGKTTSFYSAPFYTSYHGYKMCARIYLNGDGMGKGTHLSLFFVIMKGRYDNILRWPFRQKVTFMMVDQGNREHVVDAFRPDPTSSSFKKPTHEMNIASGCPLFVSLSLLENGNYAYVKDDCLFVKVIVDVSDLERI